MPNGRRRVGLMSLPNGHFSGDLHANPKIALRYLQIERLFRSWSGESRSPAWRAATGFAEKGSAMNRREFTGGLAAAALSASLGTTSAGASAETASELSMLDAQQRFLALRF